MLTLWGIGPETLGPLTGLLVDVLLAAAAYLGTSAILWVIAGRPEGAETALVNFAMRRL